MKIRKYGIALAALAQPPAPAATAETLRDAAQGQVVAWSARAASLRMLRSERAIGEAIGLAQAAAELDAIVLTVPDAARAEPLDVEALRWAVDFIEGTGDYCSYCPTQDEDPGPCTCGAYDLMDRLRDMLPDDAEARRRG